MDHTSSPSPDRSVDPRGRVKKLYTVEELKTNQATLSTRSLVVVVSVVGLMMGTALLGHFLESANHSEGISVGVPVGLFVLGLVIVLVAGRRSSGEEKLAGVPTCPSCGTKWMGYFTSIAIASGRCGHCGARAVKRPDEA